MKRNKSDQHASCPIAPVADAMAAKLAQKAGHDGVVSEGGYPEKEGPFTKGHSAHGQKRGKGGRKRSPRGPGQPAGEE